MVLPDIQEERMLELELMLKTGYVSKKSSYYASADLYS